jgi:RimJ/RimL family protein N-acetyltransferase
MGEVLIFPSEIEGTVELAFAVGAMYQGRGLARRAVDAMLGLAAEAEASSARLVIAIDNVASQRVAEATGFRRTDLPLVERRRKGFVLTMSSWEQLL